MISFLLRLGLFLLSFLGYALWVHKRDIHMAFAPALVTAGMSIAIFLAGLLNIMPLAANAIFWGGHILLIISCFDARKASPPHGHFSHFVFSPC